MLNDLGDDDQHVTLRVLHAQKQSGTTIAQGVVEGTVRVSPGGALQVSIYTYTHTLTHTHVHTYIHTYMHTYTHTYLHR